MDRLLLWVAQGFGSGRAPFAPGTFGSVVGFGWFALLLAAGNVWIYAAGTLAGIAASVWCCGKAEKILQQTDPGSVVLDEICAIPVCFAAAVGLQLYHTGQMPLLAEFFSARTWPLAVGVFLAFRFFDVLKPWPVRQSQALPGGWGVTVDDVLAGIYVSACWLAAYCGHALWARS